MALLRPSATAPVFGALPWIRAPAVRAARRCLGISPSRAALTRRRRQSTSKSRGEGPGAASASESAAASGDAPFPLRLVYTYRSPGVVLTGGGKSGRPFWPLTLLVGANAGVFLAWNWVPSGEDREAVSRATHTHEGVMRWEPRQTALTDAHHDFMTRHFAASVANLCDGRLHTLVTSGFSHQTPAHLAGNMVALVLFGYRSCAALGPGAFLGLYVAGAFACSSAHIMHNIYHGRTAPCLTSAELRGATRNALCDVNTEMQKVQRMPPWLRFGTSSSDMLPAMGGEPPSFSLHRSSMEEDDKGGEGSGEGQPDMFQRIGRLMAKTGVLVVGFFRRGDGTSDNEMKEGHPPENHGPGMSNDELNSRLKRLEREKQPLPDEVVRELQFAREDPPKKSWLQRREERLREAEAAEQRRLGEQLSVAQKLAFYHFVAPRDMPSVGASGAVMAISNGSVLLFPRDLVIMRGINMPLPAAAALYTYSDLMGVVYPEPGDLTDHAGHLAGAGAGLLFVWFRWVALRGRSSSCVSGALPIVTIWRSTSFGRR